MLPYYKADAACLLGKLDGDVDMVKMLCVGIAKTLFSDAGLPTDKGTLEGASKVVRGWLACENEWVSCYGRAMEKTGVFTDKMWVGSK